MRHTPNSRSYFARTLALTLACFIVLFLVQVVVHGHEKGQNEAACRVCHAAHISSGLAVYAFSLCTSLLPNGRVPPIDAKFHKELFAHDSPSRAPPAA